MKIPLLVVLCVVVALACLGAAGLWKTRRLEPVERARRPSDPETRFVETRSGRVHVLDVGEGDRVVLLLHGTGRSVADWQEGLAAKLSERYRVVAIDYYGHGLSDRDHAGVYGLALWARQAIDVLDALGVERASIVGHSAGGGVAAIVAADHPDRIDHAVLIGHGMAMDPMQIVPIVPGLGEWALGRTEIFSDVFSDAHRQRLTDAYAIRGTRAALLTFIRRQYTIDGLRLVLGTYEQIGAPVMQVHGVEDASIPIGAARRLTPRLPDGRLLAYEGVGHDVHVEASEPLATDIARFFEGEASVAGVVESGR